MGKVYFLSILTIFIFYFIGCSTKPKSDDLDYIPFSGYKIDSITINEGDNLQIIGFSGGKKSDEGNLHYFEFLVINKNSADTFRILTPMIYVKLSSDTGEGTYTSPASFDGSKGVFEASYLPLDSAHRFIVNLTSSITSSSSPAQSDGIEKTLSGKIIAKKWVIINKSLPMLQDPKYKTTVGILKFNQIPW